MGVSRRCSRHAGFGATASLFERCDKAVRRGMDREMRPIDPADLLGAGMDVDELGLRCRESTAASSPARGFRRAGRRPAPADRLPWRARPVSDWGRGRDRRRKADAGDRTASSGDSWSRSAIRFARRIRESGGVPSRSSGFRRARTADSSLPPAARQACAISSSPGEVSTGSNAGASAMLTRSLSMSFGSATTTGPGRPLLAV